MNPNRIAGGMVALIGPLGAGKTTFVREWVKTRSPDLAADVVSPTFILHARYVLPDGVVHHLDWYRLKSESDVWSLGWEDILNDSSLAVFVEWADKFPGLLPKRRMEIRFRFVRRSTRRTVALRTYGGQRP